MTVNLVLEYKEKTLPPSSQSRDLYRMRGIKFLPPLGGSWNPWTLERRWLRGEAYVLLMTCCQSCYPGSWITALKSLRSASLAKVEGWRQREQTLEERSHTHTWTRSHTHTYARTSLNRRAPLAPQNGLVARLLH